MERLLLTEAADSGSIPSRVKPKTIKNRYSQLSCLTFSNQRDCVKPPPCVVDRWQLDSKTERSFCCLLAKATWCIKCNYNYWFHLPCACFLSVFLPPVLAIKNNILVYLMTHATTVLILNQ